MDKPAIDQPKEDDQTPKPSVASSTVLRILKRFRSRREDAEEPQPTFDERLGAASGPLAERISEISSRIEAGRAAGSGTKVPASPGAGRDVKVASEEEDPATRDETQSDEADTATAASDASPKPRVRAMGFHSPVFPAKAPDEPKDPDFIASTEPPVLKLHDAPDGIMENSGAPERLLTAPKEKIAEPLDLKAFTEQVRSKLPKPEPELQAEDQDSIGDTETESDAAAFRQQFYSRISKASKATVFDAFPVHEEPNIQPTPSNALNAKLRDVTASSALQSWRQFQSTPDQTAVSTQSETTHNPLRVVELPMPEWSADPADTDLSGSGTPESHGGAGLESPDEATDFAAEVPDHTDYSAYEPHFDDGYYEDHPEEAADEHQAALSEPAEAPDPEPETAPTEDPEPETLTEFEPAPADMLVGEEHEPDQETETASEAPPENVFAALDIDEDEILVKVYDLIQAELQAAWGENITLNIRKIVRDEVRAAIEKARSEN